MRKSLILTVALATAAGLAGGAAVLAQGTGGPAPAQSVQPDPQASWQSLSAIAASFEGRGYKVLEIERDDGAYEMKALDANGIRLEAYVDPVKGEILRGGDRD